MSIFLLSIASILTPLLVSASPVAQMLEPRPPVPGSSFIGSLTWYPRQPDLVLASISNNSTTNYYILAKNNIFDDEHTYRPLQVQTLSGEPVPLIGGRHPYPHMADSQFKNFTVGAVWQRYLNMSRYMPLSPDIQIPTSQCFRFALPQSVDALNSDLQRADQPISDLFLTNGLVQVPVESNPLHMNVTVAPGTPPATMAPGTGPTPTAPFQEPGLILDLEAQTGSVTRPEPPPGNPPTFEIKRPAPSDPLS
ncbi:MAG: hypothetical protein L6R35_001604 [Caloplaca aegaea]|nr:MAG: hypothetical protein L6R35_001604 [Caloplaca aegaea]